MFVPLEQVVHNQPWNPDYAPSQFLTHQPATAAKSAKDCERHDRIKNRNTTNVQDNSEEVNDNNYWSKLAENRSLLCSL